MKDAKTEYQDALAAYSMPGARNANLAKLTYWGKAAGLTAEDIIADSRAAGVRDRDADIQRGWRTARSGADFRPDCGPTFTPKPKSSKSSKLFQKFIEDGRDVDSSAKLMALSPVPLLDADGKPTMTDAESARAQLLAAFDTTDKVFIFRDPRAAGFASAGKPGENLMTVADWLTDANAAKLAERDLMFRINPFTGEADAHGDNRSFVRDACISRYPNMLFEADEADLLTQCQFWAGLIRSNALRVVALTYSGGKSIHGIIRVDAATADEWDALGQKARALFCGAGRLSLDGQALKKGISARLAGSARTGGRKQRLLYLRPND